MDNLAHTLAGAALGQAGLKKKTGLGMATLMIAANLPDIDGVTMFMERGSLYFRRGWTHGPIALVVLPLLLAAAMFAFDRWQARRGKRPAARAPVHFGWLVGLAYIGTLLHPLMDFLNTYGIRCLMPFSERWFYGDALFIIDLWVWGALAVGVWLSRRKERWRGGDHPKPAVIALVVVVTYVSAMGIGGVWVEGYAAREVARQGLGTPITVVASPVPVNPFRRDVIFDLGGRYGFGAFAWAPAPDLQLDPELVPTRMDDPAVARAAAHDVHIADFLYWSRLPFADIIRKDGHIDVTVGDARYNRRPGEGRFIVRTTLPETP
ncbi:MAG: metal-dependent hydrolase [Rhodospirillaceae bacterium]